jgi:LDH2 family malate/lactate/ureidoglycolate dehydrogenase
MLIAVNEVSEVALRALIAHHVTPDHAALQADLLLDAQMRGVASHGLLRLPRVIERIAHGVSAPNAVGTHTWSASHLLQVDGQQGQDRPGARGRLHLRARSRHRNAADGLRNGRADGRGGHSATAGSMSLPRGSRAVYVAFQW